MKLKLILTTLVLVAAPSLTIAECYGGHEEITMSCPEGQSFDADTRTCITPTG